MSKTVVETITKQAENLKLPEYIELIEVLVHNLRGKSSLSVKEELDWQGLYGLGQGLWANEDAQEYVNRLREDRIYSEIITA